MYHKNDFIQKLGRKFGKFAIQKLMMYIVGGMAIMFVASFVSPVNIISLFAFDTSSIMQGEIWRIFTFIFIPPNASPIFILFALYFYWFIGSALENKWGAFRFNIFYLCGIIGTIIAGLITGFATNFYLNLSLFFAFAVLFPNFEVRLFFVLPIKIKWLAYVNLAFFVYEFIMISWPGRVALLVSILNIILFFGKDFIDGINRKRRQKKWKKNIR
ncbi:MAG: rhomboid family intramembrane serine protease [Defluviitaleaceae bacterium]|nr:rhomboid family intramembrane serine protease [Defluviitaleaceae bacterium]